MIGSKRRLQTLTRLAKLALAALCFVWLIGAGRLDFSALAHLRLGGALAGAAAARVLVCVVFALRWQGLAVAKGLHVPAWEAIRMGFVGRLFDLAAPAGLGTDGARARLGAVRNAGRLHDVASSVLVDRLLGALSISLLAIGAATLLPGEGWQTIRSALLAAGGLLLAVLAAVALSASLIGRARWQPLRSFAVALGEYRRLPRSLLRSLLVAFVGHGLVLTSIFLAFSALGDSVSWTQITLAQPLVMLSQTLPLTPAGLGVADAAAEGAYAWVGVSAGAEAMLLLRALDLISAAVGGVWLLAAPQQPQPAPAIDL